MKIIMFLFVLFLCTSCMFIPVNNTNSLKYSIEYKNKYGAFIPDDETVVGSGYNFLRTKNKSGKYIYRSFYPEKNTMTNEIFYSDNYFSIEDGPYKKFFDDGGISVEGYMKDGEKNGFWKTYSLEDDHHLRSKSLYINGLLEGESTNYVKEGIIQSKYHYENDLRNGAFIEYDSIGTIVNEGIYSEGALISSLVEEQTDVIIIVEEPPRFPGCESIEELEEKNNCSNKKLLEYIYGNLKYPEDARIHSVEGNALIQFVVDKEGQIIDVVVISGICKSIEEEVLRVVHKFPVWIPGKQNGKTVNVKYTLPVKFRLEG